ALAVPAALHFYAQNRIAAAERALGRLAGAEVHVGDAEVHLGGSLVLSDVTVGGVVTAAEVEAAVGMANLLAGRMTADEIVVLRPRVRVDAAALRLLGHLPRRGPGGAGEKRLKRIVMHDGEVTVDLGAHGTLRARDVALAPEERGVRV